MNDATELLRIMNYVADYSFWYGSIIGFGAATILAYLVQDMFE